MATIQVINIGASANDNTGDPLRTAFDKQNQNNTALNNDLATKATLANPSFSTDIIVNGAKIGKGAGNVSTNTVVGNSALSDNTGGSYNSAFGNGALNRNTNGFYNTAFGVDSLFYNIDADGSTAIGKGALQSNLGNNNTALGLNAGSGNTGFQNITCLGINSQVTANSQLQLGDVNTIVLTQQAVQLRSDIRDKADIQDTVLGLEFISKLRPVDFRWDIRESYREEMPELPLRPEQGDVSDEDFELILNNYDEDCKAIMSTWLERNRTTNLTHDGSNKRNRFHHGLIAQEVKAVIEETGVDFGGFQDHSIGGGEDVLSIGYEELITPMIKAIQELKKEIELLKSKR